MQVKRKSVLDFIQFKGTTWSGTNAERRNRTLRPSKKDIDSPFP